MERLDRGEQDAILLAESFKAERLIIDDLEGRREAVLRGIPVSGGGRIPGLWWLITRFCFRRPSRR
jgi:predicted nucleic acid-binding protein